MALKRINKVWCIGNVYAVFAAAHYACVLGVA